VVHANLLAMESSGADGTAVNIGSGAPITIREIAVLLSESLGLEIGPEITHKFRAGDIRHCFADISAARQLLGYEPRTSFAEGVGELVEWVKSQQADDRAEAAVAQLVQFGLTA
jgi:dTDP-L-rhamnose 4-epimerase